MNKLREFLTTIPTPHLLILSIYGIIVMFGCLYTCFFVPVRLSVSVMPDKIYTCDLLEHQDFKVKSTSLLGVPCGDTSFTYDVSSENKAVTIQSGGLHKTVALHPVKTK